MRGVKGPVPDEVPEGLTMDDALAAFLDGWESKREALRIKHQRHYDYWKAKGVAGGDIILMVELRRVRHYEHELRMIRELRARALPAT